MSKHLYQIIEELQAIESELEDNGGELTDELASKLDITNDNLNEKLTGYCDYIGELNAKIEYCKTEEKRIATIRKQREKQVDWLKSAVLRAIQMFGSSDKNGVKRIELPTYKLSNRRSNVVEVNDQRTKDLSNIFGEFICELSMNGALYTGEDTDLIGVLDSINAQYKAVCDETNKVFCPFTIEDLSVCPINITYTASIADYFRRGGKHITDFGVTGNGICSSIDANVSKTTLKRYFDNHADSNVSFARPMINESLTIK